MKDNEDVLKAIESMWQEYPEWRLGQILCNLATWSRGSDQGAVWELTNDEIVGAIELHLARKNQER